MPAGTPTLSDSYWLTQSPVFQHRVEAGLWQQCQNIENEPITGITGTMPKIVHDARIAFVKQVQNPGNFANWLSRFVEAAANDGNVIAAATNSSTTYTPITSAATGDTAAAEGGLVTTLLINNAISAAFDTFVPGI